MYGSGPSSCRPAEPCELRRHRKSVAISTMDVCQSYPDQTTRQARLVALAGSDAAANLAPSQRALVVYYRSCEVVD